jgi:cytochrome o ubiquinol oxidase subunit II
MKRKIYFVSAVLLTLGVMILLQGCSELVLLNPKGPIGGAERTLILIAFGLMLSVVIPVIAMSIWFPLKYRESNKKAAYDPNWSHSKQIEIVIWLLPLVIVVLLSGLLWRDTHRLDPYNPLASQETPLEVEVVSLDWKWLFIYPQQNIAVVNEFAFPAKVPLSFAITSDTVMTSFFIPQLGSQIYAMAGMRTRLHLLADEEGSYTGQNQQFSGAGYPDMSFHAIATSREKFDVWVQKVRQSPQKLDIAGFEQLRRPGVQPGVTYYSSIDPGIFEYIVNKYDPMAKHPTAKNADAHVGSGHERGMEDQSHVW